MSTVNDQIIIIDLYSHIYYNVFRLLKVYTLLFIYKNIKSEVRKMNMLDSKVIQTRFEKEIFIEEKSNIEINEFRILDKNTPFYEFMVGLDLIRIRDNEYYGNKTSYVNIRISEDLQSLFVIEPDVQSLFAIKNKQEKEAAIELIHYLLIDSQIFKQLVSEMIIYLKRQNVVNVYEVKEANTKLAVLERLLNVSNEDIKFMIRLENIA
jgi:hypothetical protein